VTQEAGEPTTELHDDDPDHFEFAHKFICSLAYDSKEVEIKSGNSDKPEEAKFITGVYTVEDKYNIWRLLQPATDHLGEALKVTPTKEVLESAIRAHYIPCSTPGSIAGKVVASTTIRYFRELVRTDDFDALLGNFPVFAADIAMYYHEQGMFNVRRLNCHCGKKVLANNDEIIASVAICLRCRWCGSTTSTKSNAW
jgi:hypothetical protein